MLLDAMKDLVAAGLQFRIGIDDWIRDFSNVATAKGIRRASLFDSRFKLEQVQASLAWGTSVGLYGESQCGKSALVSRFARAPESAKPGSRNLAIAVPTSIDSTGRIPFRKSFDPQKGMESTGVICRFVKVPQAEAERGWVRMELVTISELITSLCMGLHAESVERVRDDRVATLRQVVDRIRTTAGGLEPDPDDRMSQLRHAWDVMRRSKSAVDERLMRDLDNGVEGWDEFVDECIELRLRPCVRPLGGEEHSLFDRFVQLLWDGIPSITRIWKEMMRGLGELGLSTTAEVHIRHVMATEGQASLLDVGWINKLFGEEGGKVPVRPIDGLFADEPHPDGIPVRRSVLVSLIRAIVLPIHGESGPESASVGGDLEIIDFPGARASQRNSDFSGVGAEEHALEALRRGKLIRLFGGAVERHDASVLCLAASCSGNFGASAAIIEALRTWLDREEWNPQSTAPSMVVACTKSDVLFADGDPPTRINDRVKELGRYSPPDLDWLGNWGGAGRPFRSVFWVHNPEQAEPADWIQQKVGDEEACRAMVERCCEQSEFARHTHDQGESLHRLLRGEGEDIDELFDEIRRLASDEDRNRHLLGSIMGGIESLVAQVDSVYIGPGDTANADRARQEAVDHIASLDKALQRHVVVDLLELVSLRGHHVEEAFHIAAREAIGDAGDTIGVVHFDAFYEILKRRFHHRIDDAWGTGGAVDRPIGLIEPAEAGSGLLARFKQFPDLDWFQTGIREAVRDRLEAYNASDVRIEAVASIAAMVWNRQMIWLGEVPPVDRIGLEGGGAPGLQGNGASSRRILEHWKKRLPIAYKSLVDPKARTEPFNTRLMELRSELLAAIGRFLATPGVETDGLADRIGEIRRMQDRLDEGDAEVVATMESAE